MVLLQVLLGGFESDAFRKRFGSLIWRSGGWKGGSAH